MLKIDSVNFSHERSEPLAAYREVDCSPSRPTIFFESKSCVIFNAGPTDYWSGVLLIDTGNRCPPPKPSGRPGRALLSESAGARLRENFDRGMTWAMLELTGAEMEGLGDSDLISILENIYEQIKEAAK